jgi:acetyl-CoA synthetase
VTVPIVPVRTSYEDVVAAFAWPIPGAFNIGVACSDAQPRGDTAVVEFDVDGRHRSFTFGVLADVSSRLANALLGLGLEPGDRVAILLPQSFAAAAAHLGIYKAGLVALPLSALFGPEALEHRLADSGARAIVVDSELVENVAEIAAALDIVVIAHGDEPAVQDPHLRLADLLAGASASCPPPATNAESPAFVIYTSGTTGTPKGALHAHRSLFGHLPGFELSHSYFPQADDRFWTPADWAWIGGLMDALLPTLYLGRPIVAGPRSRFDPALAVRIIVETGVRNVFIPPTALRLMKAADVSLPPGTLRTVMSGGEALGADTLEWARAALGVTIAEIYGQTEANYLVGNAPELWDVRPGSMGRPYPGHTVAVLDERGERLAPGGVGEVAVLTPDPVAFLGYWNAEEATASKFTGDWLLTGDLATCDDDGYLWFKGRADDLIISAGYRISPIEIEQCLSRHPAVATVAVVGIPDAIRGQVVKAFVVPIGVGDDDLAKELQGFVRRQLAAYEFPREIEFVRELPMTVTGKIRRAALTARSTS